MEYTDVESQVEYGLDKINVDQKVEISLRDLMYVHNVVGEFVRFFHQPLHWETYEEVSKFIGNSEEGGLHLLCEAYYKKFNYTDIFSRDICEMIDNGEFENPDPPYYYRPKD